MELQGGRGDRYAVVVIELCFRNVFIISWAVTYSGSK